MEDPSYWSFTDGGWNRGALRLYYGAALNDYGSAGPSQPDNNGNIHRMDHFVPTALDGSGNITSWAMAADAYTYDQFNRLLNVTETPTGGSGSGFVQQYTYDRWGNRKIDTSATSNVGGGVTDIDFQVTTANNRLLAPTDTGISTDKMRYDAVGNLIWDEYSNPSNPARDFGYDAENHIGIVKDASGTELARYIYDPAGKRVRRIISGVETWQVYGLEGELIAEYAFNGSTSSPQKEYGYRGGQMLVVYDSTETGDKQWQWLVADHLGSPRMVVDRSGNLGGIRRHDYLPFGEEFASSIGHRNASGAGYTADQVRQKFTGHERDIETDLDFAEARYCASIQGRFTGPDPLMASGRVGNPQSWNRYSYVMNRPLNLIDPSGLLDEDPTDPQSGRQKDKEQQSGDTIKMGESKVTLPRILSAESHPLNKNRVGEVPVGGKFEVEYKYEINNPAGIQDANPDPKSYGNVEPVRDGGTLTGQSSPINLTATEVKVKDRGNVVEVTKKDTFEVTKDAHSVINFQVVVRDPLTSATDRLASASSDYNNREVIKYKDERGKERERSGRARPRSIFVDYKSGR